MPRKSRPVKPVPAPPLFTVKAKQYVSLVFPKAVDTFYPGTRVDFVKNLSSDEALEILAALKAAAAEIL